MKNMRGALVTDNIKLVHHICHKYFSRAYASKLFEYEDLAGVGTVGLVKAARRFEPERGYKFSTYAATAILNELRHFVRDSSPVGGIRTPRGKECRIECHSFHALLDGEKAFEEFMEAEQDYTTAEVNEFLSRLPKLERDICRLRVAGLTQGQIALALGTSQVQVHRGLKKIRAKYMAYAKGGQRLAAVSGIRV